MICKVNRSTNFGLAIQKLRWTGLAKPEDGPTQQQNSSSCATRPAILESYSAIHCFRSDSIRQRHGSSPLESKIVLKHICSIIIEEVVIEFSKIIHSVLLEYWAALTQGFHVPKRAIDNVPVWRLNHYGSLICDYVFKSIVAKDLLNCFNLIIIKEVTIAVQILEDTILEQKGPIEARAVLTIKVNNVWAQSEILVVDRYTIRHLLIRVIHCDCLVVVGEEGAVVKGEGKRVHVVIGRDILVIEEKDLAMCIKFE